MGLLFRVWFGRGAPAPILRTLFFPEQGNPIYSAEGWDVLGPVFSELFSAA